MFNEKKTAYKTKVAQDAADLKKKQDKEKNEALAQQGDKAVWGDFVARLGAVVIPEFTSEEYKSKASAVVTAIKAIQIM